jgi:hypothetical protein
MNGRTVRHLTGLASDRTTLDVGLLPDGLYIVAAQTTQGTLVRKLEVRSEK